MSVDQMLKAETIFAELADLPAGDRETILTERCEGNEQLRDFVKKLLAEHDRGLGEFMQSPPAEVVGPDLEPMDRVGAYRLVERIGEGGFGEVHLAEQTEPIRRTVALKIVKLGMDTRQVVARFEAERQALALMDHPHIARVFEAGATEHGRPYFAMEHVPGVAITDYCDKHRLGMEQRLQLFIHVCDAIQHAHQKGIIHRDLKPSNILIERFGEEHVPKVIDFGIAKAMGFSLTERTPMTEQGQLIGTPDYMSPEQAVLSTLNVDTRADIYSLGVMLYELLAGTLPFAPQTFQGRGFNEIQRIIREVEPPKPSTRFSTLDGERAGDGESSVDVIAACRRTDAKALQRRLRGDLDWITMKAMDKDRERRYASVSELAADVRHHLRHEPVLAGPPGTVYKLRKLMRRHRLGVTAAAIVVLVLFVASAATTWQAIRATDAERLAEDRLADANDARLEAEQQTEIAEAVNEFLHEDVLATVRPEEMGREVTMLAVLAAASGEIDDAFPDQPLVRGEVLVTLGKTYRRLGEYDLAGEHLAPALELLRAERGDDHLSTLTCMNDLGAVYTDLGRLDDAEALLTESLTKMRQALGAEHPDTAAPLNNLGSLREEKGDFAGAETAFGQAADIARRAFGDQDARTVSVVRNLAGAVMLQGHWDDAERLYLEALEAAQSALGPDDPRTLTVMNDFANVYMYQDLWDQAEPLLEESLEGRRRIMGAEHSDTLASMNNLAIVRAGQRRFAEAVELYESGLEIARRTLGTEHPRTLATMNNLAHVYQDQGDDEKAARLYGEVLEGARRVLGEGHPNTLITMRSFADAQIRLGRHGEAEDLCMRAVELAPDSLGPEHRLTLSFIMTLGDVYQDEGRYEEAEHRYAEALEIARRAWGEDDTDTAAAMNRLARAYGSQQRYEEAEPLLREATGFALRTLPPGDPRTASYQRDWGACLMKLHRFEEAESQLLAGYEALRTAFGSENPGVLAAVEALVELYEDWDQPKQAAEYRELLKKAQAVMARD